jgi:hypothetical protein
MREICKTKNLRRNKWRPLMTDAGKPIIEQGTTNLLGHNAQVHLHMLQRENKAEERLPK